MKVTIRQRIGEAGYSVVELVFVVGIMGVLASMAVFQIGQSRPAALGDGAMRVVLSQMTAAREQAITQRRNMRMTFSSATVTVIREEVTVPQTFTTLMAIPFEGGLTFNYMATGDSPDAFVAGTPAAVNLPTATGIPPEAKWTPEGTFVNQDGITMNATIFVGLGSQKMSARVITILGSTGRVRGYRWDGANWKPV
jgi:type II secretory pathway pseudopilin PulG